MVTYIFSGKYGTLRGIVQKEVKGVISDWEEVHVPNSDGKKQLFEICKGQKDPRTASERKLEERYFDDKKRRMEEGKSICDARQS